ncbi:MAG: beta-galactosidase [Candidatus Xenobia bacterium]
MKIRLLLLFLFVAWAPAPGGLTTRWGRGLDPSHVLGDYPRPQMARSTWMSLNGLWSYSILPSGAQGEILVPFPIESSLSGVGLTPGSNKRLLYRRQFTVPPEWARHKVLLHFGAVDWDATVRLNGEVVSRHQGGFDPFEVDLTPHLRPGTQDLSVTVRDLSDQGQQPRGKQVLKPRSIWYTPVTGIWQTVWLEPVPRLNAIRDLRIVPDVDRSEVRVTVETDNPTTVTLTGAGVTVSGPSGQPLALPVSDPHLWSPEDPFLYDLTVRTPDDQVQSYFGLRKISLGQDAEGKTRILLNDRFVFQFGPLDQGWWPDGLYTAPSDEALRYDLDITKKLGFNMVRKHIKTEPQRWYTYCDRMGLLVWQDMPSGGPEAPWTPEGKHDRTELNRTPDVKEIYEREWAAIIDSLENHPSIVVWVPFNEGWGQFDTERITRWTMERDPSRLVNPASGGNDFPVGHMRDIHRYPGPYAPPMESQRAIVLGEFGGLGWPVPGHIWQQKDNWGYRTLTSREELNSGFLDLLEKLAPMVDEGGLSAAVYTQTTDVEGEVNGLMTYDREVLKLDADRVAPAVQQIIGRFSGR